MKTKHKQEKLNCDISENTRYMMNEHISKKGVFQYAFINDAILEKIERDTKNA